MNRRWKVLVLLITLSFLSARPMIAQGRFVQKGARWSYLFNNRLVPQVFEIANTYLRDTIVNSDTINILGTRFINKNDNDCYTSRYTYIRQKKDTVYFKNVETNNTWQILYNFAATAGQQWQTTVYHMVAMTYTVVVDSVRTVNVNGIPLRQLAVRYKYGTAGADTTLITDRLGCHNFMFNYNVQECATDQPWFRQYLCYRDSIMGAHQMSNLPCNYSATLGVYSMRDVRSTLQITPNPAANELTLRCPEYSLLGIPMRIITSTGQTIDEITIDEEYKKIDVSTFCPGIYYFLIPATGHFARFSVSP